MKQFLGEKILTRYIEEPVSKRREKVKRRCQSKYKSTRLCACLIFTSDAFSALKQFRSCVVG